MQLVHTEEVVWSAGLPAIQTFMQASLPRAGTGYGGTGAACPSWTKIPSTVLVAVNRSPCHLHTSRIAPAHARVALL